MKPNEKIKLLRKEMGMSQMAFAMHYGYMATQIIYFWEKGIRSPTVATCYKMIKDAKKHGFKWSLEDFLPDKE